MRVLVRYLQEKKPAGGLLYRRVFPSELLPFISARAPGLAPPTEVKRALGGATWESPGVTERFKAAADEYAETVALAASRREHGRKIAAGEADPITPILSDYLVGKYKTEELAFDEEMRWIERPAAAKYRTLEVMRRDIANDLAECRALKGAGDLGGIQSAWGTAVVEIAARYGFTIDPKDSSFPMLCKRINDASIEVWEATEARMDGHEVLTPPEPAHPTLTQAAERPVPMAASFDSIAEAILESPRHAISASTRQQARTALRSLQGAFGKPRPSEITKAMVSEWLDLLACRPVKLPPEHKELTVRELAALYDGKDAPRMQRQTMSKLLAALSSLWNKAQREEGHIPDGITNPFVGRRSLAGQAEKQKQFGPDELNAIFALPVFTAGYRPKRGKGEASYWLPLLMLWTGARPEELAQLLVSDVFEQGKGAERRWMLRITNAGDHPWKGKRTLKTEKGGTGEREFPIHGKLLDLNFIEYVEHVRDSGEVALFPKLRTKGGERADLFAGFGEWWSLYLYTNGVLAKDDGWRPARAFRHAWTTAARVGRIPEDAREYLQGHSRAGASANDVYGEKDSLGDYALEVTFAGLDLSAVRAWSLT